MSCRGATELEVLHTAELRRRFPQFSVDAGAIGVYDSWGGYLESGRAIEAMESNS